MEGFDASGSAYGNLYCFDASERRLGDNGEKSEDRRAKKAGQQASFILWNRRRNYQEVFKLEKAIH